MQGDTEICSQPLTDGWAVSPCLRPFNGDNVANSICRPLFGTGVARRARRVPAVRPLGEEDESVLLQLRQAIEKIQTDELRDHAHPPAQDLVELAAKLDATLEWLSWALATLMLQELKFSSPLDPEGRATPSRWMFHQVQRITKREHCTISKAMLDNYGPVCIKTCSLDTVAEREDDRLWIFDTHTVCELSCQRELIDFWTATRAEETSPFPRLPCVLLLGGVLSQDKLHLVYPWVEGPTLYRVIRRESWPVRQSLAQHGCNDLLYALRFMHCAGVSHADLKADNVMVRNGHFVLIDFGCGTTCAEVNYGHHQPRNLMWVGAFHIRSPERLVAVVDQGRSGRSVRRTTPGVRTGAFAADAWAVGLLLAALVTGIQITHPTTGAALRASAVCRSYPNNDQVYNPAADEKKDAGDLDSDLAEQEALLSTERVLAALANWADQPQHKFATAIHDGSAVKCTAIYDWVDQWCSPTTTPPQTDLGSLRDKQQPPADKKSGRSIVTWIKRLLALNPETRLASVTTAFSK